MHLGVILPNFGRDSSPERIRRWSSQASAMWSDRTERTFHARASLDEPLLVALPPAALEQIASRATELVLERLGAVPGSPWMTRDRAAAYLGLPVSRLEKTRPSPATATAAGSCTTVTSSTRTSTACEDFLARLAFALGERLTAALLAPRMREEIQAWPSRKARQKTMESKAMWRGVHCGTSAASSADTAREAAPERCPMCGGTVWEFDSSADLLRE